MRWIQFFAPLSFPQQLLLGLRVSKLGNSSVTYEVAVFADGKEIGSPAVVGGYTHVFVDHLTRRSKPEGMGEKLRVGLQRLRMDRSEHDSKL